MKNVLTTTVLSLYSNAFAYRRMIPVAVIMTLIILSLLLPGTVLAGPGSSSSACGSC